MLAASRKLGEAVSSGKYPTAESIDRETHFNAFNPFWQAPFAYGAALALLAVSLGFVAGRTSSAGRLGQGLYLAGMTGLAHRYPPRGVRLLSADSDFGMGTGDEYVRDRHLGGPGGRGPVVRLRADLSQDVHRAGRVGRGAPGHDHGGQRAAPGPQHPQLAAGAPQQLLADDPRADRGVQLRGVWPGLGAGLDRDALLPDGHLPPLAELRRVVAAADSGPSAAGRRNGRRGRVVRCLRRAVGHGRPALLCFCDDGTGRRHGLAGCRAGDRR